MALVWHEKASRTVLQTSSLSHSFDTDTQHDLQSRKLRNNLSSIIIKLKQRVVYIVHCTLHSKFKLYSLHENLPESVDLYVLIIYYTYLNLFLSKQLAINKYRDCQFIITHAHYLGTYTQT